jgi:glucose-1-phosphate adenylyltransferase
MNVLTLILAGGEGSRLSILGEKRAKPAVPFGGKYRIIDFALSNTVNSDLYRVAVLTQYRPHSLMQHIGIGDPWDLDRRRPDGVQIWQPYRGRSDQGWYRGTSDALYQNRSYIAEDGSDLTLVLSGDHIYKQDYRDLLRYHRDTGADLTVAVMHVRPDEVHRFGIMTTDANQRIVKFTEKPPQSASTLASMGIYVFNTQFLLQRLEEDAQDTTSAHDFGKSIIPKMVANDNVFAYPFQGYWVDVGTIDAYWSTNLDLLNPDAALDLHDDDWVIRTRSEERAPVKFGPHGDIDNCLLSNGCVINGTVINSVLSPGVRVERGAVVRDAVIMNDTVVRAGAVVDRCVLDKEIVVGAGAQLGVGDDQTPNETEPRNIHAGITIVGKRAHIPDGAVIGRNCRIDSATSADDYDTLEIASGKTITRRVPLTLD